MNDLRLDYTKKGKHSSKTKRLLLISGVGLIILSLVTLIILITSDISLSLIIPASANILMGTIFIFQSIEHKILYPKKFIYISAETIEFKLGGFFREKRIEWSSIDRVSTEGKTVHIHSGEHVTKINMFHFTLMDEKRIKAAINAIAEEKQ